MGRFGLHRPSVRRQINYSAILAEHAQREAYEGGKAEAEAKMLAVDSPDSRDPADLHCLATEKLRA